MKPERVIFIDEELENSFNELSDNDPIKRSIKRAIQFIQEDFTCGRNVKKELIPKILIEKYSINNLWIYDCSKWVLYPVACYDYLVPILRLKEYPPSLLWLGFFIYQMDGDCCILLHQEGK